MPIHRWRLSAFVFHHRWVLAVGAGLLALLGIALAPQIKFDYSPWAILEGYESRLSDAGSVVASGDNSEILLLLVESAEGETVLSEPGLVWQRWVVGEIMELPGVGTVYAFCDIPGGTSPLMLPRLTGYLISEDRQHANIVIRPATDDDTAAQIISRRIDEIVAGSPPPQGWQTHQAGWPAIHAMVMRDLRSDQHRLMPVSGVVIVILLAVAFRRTLDVLLPLLTIVAAMAWFMVFMAATGQTIGLLSGILPAVLFAIGTANCVHILTRHIETGSLSGFAPRRAALRTLWQMALPCLLTVTTTAIGFATLYGARAGMLHTFAWQAVVGLALLYVALLWLMIGLLPLVRRRSNGEAIGHDLLARSATAMASLGARRPKIVLLVGLAVLAACVWSGQRSPVNASIAAVYDKDNPILEGVQIVEDHFMGFSEVAVVLEAESAEALSAAETAAALNEFVVFAKKQDLVLKAEPPVGEMGRMVVEEETGRAGRQVLTLRVDYLGSRSMCALVDKLNEGLATAFEGMALRARLGGQSVDYARVIRWVVQEFMISFVGTSVVILTLIGLLFRSIRMGLIAVIPNAVPLAVTWGYIGLMGYDMNISNIIIFSIGLGMAVDDSVHALARFRQEIAVDGDVSAAIHRCYRSTGRAIILTTIVIVVGMSVLLASNFVPTRRFAELTAVTMIAAVLGDVILLPACLKLFWRPRRGF